MAGDHNVSLKEDANGVVKVTPLAISCEFFFYSLCTLLMLPLTVAAYTPNNCKLSHRVCVVATEFMVARHMMILYMRGAYSTPSKVYSFLEVRRLACVSAIKNFARHMLIIVFFCFVQVWASGCPGLQNLSHAVLRVALLIWL